MLSWIVALALAGPTHELAPGDPFEKRGASSKEAARAQVAKARKAAQAGDFRKALRHFERALDLHPTPGLRHNIAVCHHQLMLGAQPGSRAYESSRAEAVAAYNRYLEAAPDADDRDEVAGTIVALGGRPVTDDDWLVEPKPEPGAAPPTLHDDEVKRTSPPTSEPPTPPPFEPAGRIGFGLGVSIAHIQQLSDTSRVETLPLLSAIVRGGGFFGKRNRLIAGGEIALQGQPSNSQTRHILVAGYLGPTLDFAHVLGKAERFEIGGGGLIAIAGEQLRHQATSGATCPDSSKERVSGRVGGLFAVRLTMAVLLGRRRQHELALRITPGLGVYGAGKKGDQNSAGEPCDSDAPTPFEEFGLDAGPALVMGFDLGYAPRL